MITATLCACTVSIVVCTLTCMTDFHEFLPPLIWILPQTAIFWLFKSNALIQKVLVANVLSEIINFHFNHLWEMVGCQTALLLSNSIIWLILFCQINIVFFLNLFEQCHNRQSRFKSKFIF